MANDPPAQDPPAPAPDPALPDEESIRALIREEIAAALADDEPDPEPAPAKASTAREREAIAEAAAAKAVAAIKAADPKPAKEDGKPPVAVPVKKTRFRAAADKFWDVVDEAVKP